MSLFIIIVLITGVLLLVADAGILLWIKKLFKIENPSYKNSLIIVVLSGIASIIAGLVFSIIDLGFLSNILVTIATFFVFHFFLKKYYQNSWKKSLVIFIAHGVVISVLSVLVVVPTRFFVIEPFIVNGKAMNPIYDKGDYLLIRKFDKNFIRGNVVLLRYPKDPSKFFIKRIIGLPSDTVEIKNGTVIIKNVANPEGVVINEPYIKYPKDETMSRTLDKEEFFVMGDNRAESSDSRNWGPVPLRNIEGVIFYKVELLSQ